MRRAQVYSDPLQHALIAAAVVAPLAGRAGRRVVATAVVAAIVIDVDHAVAARSVRVRDTTALADAPAQPQPASPRSAPARGRRRGGRPAHGWAAFGGLVSHLLHDAGDRAAPTPLLWPFAPARQLGRRWQLAATAALALGFGRRSAAPWQPTSPGPSAGGAGDGGAAARPRTA